MKEVEIGGYRWTAISAVSRFLISFSQVAVLARILDPSAFGLQALSLALIVFIQIFADFGLGSSVIVIRDVSLRTLSSIYWLSVLLGLSLSVAVFLLGWPIAVYYNKPEVQEIVSILSLSFFVVSVAQIIRIIAEKKLQFKALALVDIAASLAGFVTSTILALGGYGASSLAVGYVVSALVASALLWVFVSDGWFPTEFGLDRSVLRYLRFGGGTIAINLFNSLSAQIDLLLVGRQFGPTQVGAYSQPRDLALRLSNMVNVVITKVSFPLIASKATKEEHVANIYMTTIRLSSMVNFPIFVFVAVYAEQITASYLGAAWSGAAVYLQGSAAWAAARSVGNPIGSLLIGTGRVKHALWSSMAVSFGVLIVVIISLSVYDLEHLMWHLCFYYTLLIFPFWWFNIKPVTGIGFIRYHSAIFQSVIASSIAGFAMYLISRLSLGDYLTLAFGGPVGAVTYIIVSKYVNPEGFSLLKVLTREIFRSRQ